MQRFHLVKAASTNRGRPSLVLTNLWIHWYFGRHSRFGGSFQSTATPRLTVAGMGHVPPRSAPSWIILKRLISPTQNFNQIRATLPELYPANLHTIYSVFVRLAAMEVSAELTVAILGVIVTVPSAVIAIVRCRRNRHSNVLLPIASG